MINLPLPMPPTPLTSHLGSEAFDELDAILDELRTRDDEVPQWEFCEGFMVALICCRRPIAPSEYLPVMLGMDLDATVPTADTPSFASLEQSERFMALWRTRWSEVAAALDTEIEALDDERAYAPEILDVRGAVAGLSEQERAELDEELDVLPAFGQVWALGFMLAVENWPDDWEPPRDKELAQVHEDSLDAIVAMTDGDDDEPTLSALSEDGPLSVSQARLDAYGDALWAVYDLRQIWCNLGPRVPTVRKAPEPGRNDPCPCGSGKKFKKCHGA